MALTTFDILFFYVYAISFKYLFSFRSRTYWKTLQKSLLKYKIYLHTIKYSKQLWEHTVLFSALLFNIEQYFYTVELGYNSLLFLL